MKKGKSRTRVARRDIVRENAKRAIKKPRDQAVYDRKAYDGTTREETP
jgi:hypothetical protein